MSFPLHICNMDIHWYFSILISVVNFAPHKGTKKMKEILFPTPLKNRRKLISKISKRLVWFFSNFDQEGGIIFEFLSIILGVVTVSHEILKMVRCGHHIVFFNWYVQFIISGIFLGLYIYDGQIY